MNKNKAKRKSNIFGWTKASHKGAIIYFTNPKKNNKRGSLKKKKGCKFNGGVHQFEKAEHLSAISHRFLWWTHKCKYCGKTKLEFKKAKIVP